ncbi:uncharacterized protein Pyn_13742 [Prunus yedoensis var. nudiflora]|uniref:Uncharacterized protein n=1 Tax=Prunus yedoensis var. nudiflora TaxID=2094558 RepID=A0A314YQ39_PRUYE|nr:uncharacterized protein Pyn_13742 [Prunus yedoensis var. nudiflora]
MELLAVQVTTGIHNHGCKVLHWQRPRSVLLRESIRRRIFPPELDQLQEWERLRKEVLVPLTKYYSRQYRELLYDDRYHREALERHVVKKYLEEVKAAAAEAGGNLRGGIIQPDALLPNVINDHKICKKGGCPGSG